MPNAFAPFDYGQVAGNVANIQGARTRNALAQQQEQRAQTTFNQEQQRANTEDLYRGLLEISENPAAVDQHVPRWKEMGIMRGDFDYSNMTHFEIKEKAKEGAAAIGKALGISANQKLIGKYNPGDFTPGSWAKFIEAGGGHKNSALLERYEAPTVTDVGGGKAVVDRSGGGVGTVTPLSTPDQEADAAAKLAGSQESAKLKSQMKWKPAIMTAVKRAELQAKEQGEAFTDLSRAEAAMPGLNETVAELKDLAAIATSTLGGRAWDQIVQQTGFGATEGATAQAKFIAIVNNQVLPLLKPTFGAAFTVQEGESLKATMGDPNATPEAKMAQLDAFIQQKYRDIRTKKAQLDAGSKAPNGAVDNDPLGLR